MKSGKKHSIVLAMVLSFLFLSCMAYAAQPSVITSKPNEGLEIIYPIMTTIPLNTPHIFNFHISNVSNGWMLDAKIPITCYFHLYNISGEHLCDLYFNSSDYEHKFDIEVPVTAQNFSYVGAYTIWFGCNTSSLGGQMKETIYATADGIENSTYNSVTLMALLIGITLALAAATFLFAYLYANTDAVQKHLKILFLGASLLMGIASLSVQEIFSNKFDPDIALNISDTIGSIYTMSLWVFRLVMAVFIVWLIWTTARNALAGGKSETSQVEHERR